MGAGGEGDDWGWDGWMASPTQWTRVWVNSGSWWWKGRSDVLRFTGLQRVGHDWVTELNWTFEYFVLKKNSCDLKTKSTLGSIDLIPSTKTHLSWLLEAGGSDSKEFSCNERDLVSVPGSGRSPGEGNGNPFHYSCLESSMDRGTWQATVHRVAKSRTLLKWLSMHRWRYLRDDLPNIWTVAF